MCSIIQTVSYIRSQPDGIITFWNERVNYEFYTNVNCSNILFVVHVMRGVWEACFPGAQNNFFCNYGQYSRDDVKEL